MSINKIETKIIKSPIGNLKIMGSNLGILSIDFIEDNIETENDFFNGESENSVVDLCAKELIEYFRGERKEFDVLLDLSGTEFQTKVWNELVKVGYGQTTTYGEIAKRIGNGKASRAVGGANNKNKIPIIIPCHRIIGVNDKLTGYAGGLWRKEWLLELERSGEASK